MTTSADQSLLHALSQPHATIAAFQAWQTQVSLDQLPPGHFELLPDLYERLAQTGVVHPWKDRLKGIYRQAWVREQRVLAQWPIWVGALQAEAVPILSLGTASPRGALCVPVDCAHRAISVLASLGLHPVPATAQVDSPAFRRWMPACRLGTPEGVEVMLRWHILDERPTPAADQRLWDHAVPTAVSTKLSANIHGTPALTLANTEAFFVACITACRPIPDALLMLARAATMLQAQAISWDQLDRLATDLGLCGELGLALGTLADTLNYPIPWDLLRCPRNAMATESEGPIPKPAGVTPFGALRLHLRRFAGIARAQGVGAGPAAFVSYLQHAWGLARPLDILTHIAKRLTLGTWGPQNHP